MINYKKIKLASYQILKTANWTKNLFGCVQCTCIFGKRHSYYCDEIGMKIRAPWMNTVFYIKTYKTEINTNSKINSAHEHLLTEIASQSPKQDRRLRLI